MQASDRIGADCRQPPGNTHRPGAFQPFRPNAGDYDMAKLQKIVCALDLSEHSKLVAEYATMLAKMSGASIVAVYAAPTLTQYTGFHVPPNTIDSFVGEIVSGAEKAMADFVAEYFPDVQVKAEVVVGYAAEEILSLAENEDADLIVMGTHGRKGIDRILFGSVAEKVVKNSSRPVLTIRPSDDLVESDEPK